jgi:hypothetical protein
MDLISILWMTVGVMAAVFAIDAFVTRFVFGKSAPHAVPSRLTAFGVIMLLFAIGCFVIGMYELTT